MATQTRLKLTVDQVAAAIRLLDREERRELKSRLAENREADPDAFAFWDSPAEDVYDDLIPADRP
ncbi:MAG: hypothetical protein WD557_13675 [Dehalococcoidia bacterium]